MGFVPDLMDRSRLAAAVPSVRFVSDLAELSTAAAEADVLVVDLGRPGTIDALPELVATGRRVVGFASHVDRATIERAAATGCEAMPRSRFFSRLGDL